MEAPEVLLPSREDGGGGVCGLCLSAPGRYTCPRCNSPYCSVACYRGPRHTACSELFYRESVMQALRAEGPQERRRMEETLLRLRDEEAADPGQELWRGLTPEERDHFMQLLRSGGIGALVPEWRPWWHPEDRGQGRIQELPHQGEETPHCRVPALLSVIPPLSSLCPRPSPLVRYSVVSVLYSYAFSMLRHNGDLDILLDFTGTLLATSGALSTTAVYQSSALALRSALRAACDPQTGGDERLACSAMEATAHILQGDGSKRYALAALSHLCRLLGRVCKHAREEKAVRKSAYAAKKKCLFLAAWVNENQACLSALSAEVMAEHAQYVGELGAVVEISRGLQRLWGGKRPPEKKKLVQEIPPETTDSET
ncbi:zinc finger HIT domain-containing protein 2-like [Gastrophryne carolinensis]